MAPPSDSGSMSNDSSMSSPSTDSTSTQR
jgi:hypothetical protein